MLQPLIRRHTRQPLSSLHICASTHPSTCEHQHDMLRCMAKGWHAWHRYHRRAARAKRRPSRSSPIIAAHGLGTPAQKRKARHTQFFNGSIFLHGTFDGDQRTLWRAPRCTSGMRAVRCRGAARAFGQRLLVLSEKQTLTRDNVYLPVQRVPHRHASRAHGRGRRPQPRTDVK